MNKLKNDVLKMKRQKHPYKYLFSSKEGVRLLSTLILPRHTYLYIFTLSILKIMCKFAKLTKTHRKVNSALIPFSYSNQLQKNVIRKNQI